jgi:hypothetical protein
VNPRGGLDGSGKREKYFEQLAFQIQYHPNCKAVFAPATIFLVKLREEKKN